MNPTSTPKKRTGGPDRCAYCSSPKYRSHPDGTPLCVKHYWRSYRRGWVHDVEPKLVALTEEQVQQIPRLLAAGLRQKDIAELFGVHHSVISTRSRLPYHPGTEAAPKPRRRKAKD